MNVSLLGVDEAGAAVAEADGDVVVEAAQRGDAALAAAAHVGPLVVGLELAVERALEEAAVHPAGAAVAGDVLAVLPVTHAGVRLDPLEVVLLQQDVLPPHVVRFFAAVALERLADDDGVAQPVREAGRDTSTWSRGRTAKSLKR